MNPAGLNPGGARSFRLVRASTSCAGFTLIELLVAASITVLMAGLAAGILRQIGESWRRASGRLAAEAQARRVLDQLERDLQGALYRDDDRVWFAADVLDEADGGAGGLWQRAVKPKPTGGLSLQLAASRISDARFGTAGVWLRFFTTGCGPQEEGNLRSIAAPVAVGYRVIRRAMDSNSPGRTTAYLLHRTEVRPAAMILAGGLRPGVFESGYDLASPAYAGAAQAANDGSMAGDPLGILRPGSDQTGYHRLDRVLADHVIDFGVRCHVRDENAAGGLRLVFPADDTGQLTNDGSARIRSRLPGSTRGDSGNLDGVFPEVIDIMVRILTAEGAARLARLEEGSVEATAKYHRDFQEGWWGIALEHSQVHVRRIMLRAVPL